MIILVGVTALLAIVSVWLIAYSIKEDAMRKAVSGLEAVANDCVAEMAAMSLTLSKISRAAANAGNSGVLTSMLTLCYDLKAFNSVMLILAASHHKNPEVILSTIELFAYAQHNDAVKLAKRLHAAIQEKLLNGSIGPTDKDEAIEACKIFEECIQTVTAARERVKKALKDHGYGRILPYAN